MSVRSAAEVGAALAGGADIIDAKEPARGGLGAVDGDTLRGIAREVPAGVPLSVALGDFRSPAEVTRTIRELSIRPAGSDLFLKLGFAGASGESLLAELIAAAVEAAERLEPAAAVVAVAYADWLDAGSPPPDAVSRAAAWAGATGVLVDTNKKEGRNLFDWMAPAALGAWIADAHRLGLLAAVAGSLQAEHLDTLCGLYPDIVGVRGAACDSGRLGRVSAIRVATLRSRVDMSGKVPAKRHTAAPTALA